MDRIEKLNQLLSMSEEVSLSQFPWDSDVPLVQLRAEHLTGALSKFISGLISNADIEKWANEIEGRDDVGYLLSSPVGQVLNELANPYLTRTLSAQRASEMIDYLQTAAD